MGFIPNTTNDYMPPLGSSFQSPLAGLIGHPPVPQVVYTGIPQSIQTRHPMPGLVSLSVRAVSCRSDGLWLGRAGFRQPPALFYAEEWRC